MMINSSIDKQTIKKIILHKFLSYIKVTRSDRAP